MKSVQPATDVAVQKYAKLTKAVVTSQVYACGRVVRVENLVSSTHVDVTDLNAPGSPVIGTAENTGTVAPVFTSPLVQGHDLRAVQIACPDDPAKRIVSPNSASVSVQANPTHMPKPRVEKGFVEGTEVLFAHDLLPGAEVEFRAGPAVISSGGFANSADNLVP